MRFTPESLAQSCGGRLLRGGRHPIEGAFIDSREPRAAGLFVPIVAQRDGHDFIDAAIAAGASAVLQHRGRPMPAGDCTVVEVSDTLDALTALGSMARDHIAGPVVAITGSNGKTTTRAMVEAVLKTGFDSVLSTRGNFNNHLGVPLSLLGEPHDPNAAVLELGMSAPGENDHLASLVRPTAGVITSIALEHLEFMGSLEAIARAEAEVMPHIAGGGVLVLPNGEPLLEACIPSHYEPSVLRCGTQADSDLRVVETEVGLPTKARIRVPGGRELVLNLQVFGAHNAKNAASALAVGLSLGFDLDAMVDAIEAVEPVGDRGRVHPLGVHLVIADCYNANPGSMEVALRSLGALTGYAKLAVVGDMLELGPTEKTLHGDVGHLCASLGIRVCGIGPRTEATVEAAGTDAQHFSSIDALTTHVASVLRAAPPTAVLIKASRGLKLERVVNALLAGA